MNFIPADVEGVLRYVSQNPTRFGFTAASVLASSPACGTTVGLVCAPAQLVSPDAQQTYLWGDPNHLSTAGQTIEADYIYSLLAAPRQIRCWRKAPSRSGCARTATIQRQIDLSGQHRGPNGVNAWVSAGADSLSFNTATDFPNVSGIPFGGTAWRGLYDARRGRSSAWR